ncbi:hypothetical protein UlMin_005428, partial [Ulmus minor]
MGSWEQNLAQVLKEVFWLMEESEKFSSILKRRSVLLSGISLVSSRLVGFPSESLAVVKQGFLLGGTYWRPDEKSRGHGVGWSPIIPCGFRVPVSIANLGGTKIDLRFGRAKKGGPFVIVAHALQFAGNLGEDAKTEKIGPPEKVISAFGPKVIGENVEGLTFQSPCPNTI